VRYISRLALICGALLGLLFVASTGLPQLAPSAAPVAAADDDPSCVRLPPRAGGQRDDPARNPRRCTPTPTAPPTNTGCDTLPPQAGGQRDDPPRPPRRCTPTPPHTPRPTNAPAATATPTVTPTATNTSTPTSTPTATATPTNTPTSTPTNTPTSTATPTFTPTATATATATSTPTPLPPAAIGVYNTGGFFVQFYVSYTLPGVPLQSLYSGVFNINQGVTLTIPGNATNVGVLIQEYTGITGWQTACTRAYARATSVVIVVSGTPFLATCTGG